MAEGEDAAASAAQAARELAATLLEQADALDLHDLRATTAIEQVRVMSRVLADAVHERGWGELYLGIDSLDPDEDDDLDEFADPSTEPETGSGSESGSGSAFDAEFGPELGSEEDDAWILDDEEFDEPPALPAGIRVSYQARYDFIVTDPDALVEYVRERAAAEGADDVMEEIQDPVAAFQLLSFLDGIGSKDYDTVGLGPAGGEESQKVVSHSLWDLDPVRRDDTYPY
jgi:hypothetical protein